MIVAMTTRLAAAPSPASTLCRAASLVCLPSPEQRDFAFLDAEITLRLALIARLEAEIAPIAAALEKFEWEYRARLGDLQTELRGLHDIIERLEHRTVRIHARLVADPDGMLGDLFTRDELNEIGDMFGIEIPASWFAANEDDERKARERGWRYFRDGNANQDAEEEILRRLRRGRHRRLPENERKQIRSLYLALARRCHPDLARNESDRARRQDLMLRINDAWHRQDLDALHSIEQEHGGTFGWRPFTNWAERVLWARRECVRLDEQVVALSERLRALRGSETFPLWFNPVLGNSVITQRAVTLRIDIANAHHRVDEAKESFRQALHHYAAAVA
ncbi:hypothetical protein BH20CHL3_BH20CHL3_12470 [soil metagenome]